MELPGSEEIARSFLDWTTDDVVKWLTTLSLSHDYSANFREWGITGAMLIKLSPATLNEMTIKEGADRVKILQHTTTMRADLIPSSHTKRAHSPMKMRRFSEVSRLTYNNQNRQQHTYVPRQTTSLTTTERAISPAKQVNATLRESSPMSAPFPTSPSQYSGDLSSDSPASSRMSSPVKFREHSTPEARMHYYLQTDSDPNGFGHPSGFGGLTRHNVNRRSRSLDGLFQEGEDIFTMVERKESCSSRLVEILREENTSLKRELESYYKRVRKLQKLQQELEHVRQAQRLLEANTLRREKLEKAMRTRLEQELLKLREDSLQRKAELNSTNRQDQPKESKARRELKRRDTMIMRLIKQNKEATAVREQLEKDLYSTQAALRDKGEGLGRGRGTADGSDAHHNQSASVMESKAALMYTESIEKLKAVLSAMQNLSKKREELEKRLRTKLEGEITQLKEAKPVAKRWGLHSNKESGVADKTTIAKLEADVTKWEQKCLELVAERQMAFEIATVPRDTRISQLQQRLAEVDDASSELEQQKSAYISQLTETHQTITELETCLSSLQASIEEKDSVIQTLQNSFLEPDEDINSSHPPPPSPSKKPSQNHLSLTNTAPAPNSNHEHLLPPSSSTKKQLQNHLAVTNSAAPPPTSSHGGVEYLHPPPSPSKKASQNHLNSHGEYLHPPPSPSKSMSPHLYNGGHQCPVNGVTRPPILHAKPVSKPSSSKTVEGSRSTTGVYLDPLKLTTPENSPPYTSSPFHRNIRQFAPIHSHSAPNSPRVRVARKPRTSQPNLRLPSNHGVETGSHTPNRLSPNVISKSQFRAMKSKTPPPNYKVSTSHGQSSSDKDKHSNERRFSADGLLDDPSSKSRLELFESLVSEKTTPNSLGSSPLTNSRGGVHGQHRHSKSSPTSYDQRIQI